METLRQDSHGTQAGGPSGADSIPTQATDKNVSSQAALLTLGCPGPPGALGLILVPEEEPSRSSALGETVEGRELAGADSEGPSWRRVQGRSKGAGPFSGMLTKDTCCPAPSMGTRPGLWVFQGITASLTLGCC